MTAGVLLGWLLLPTTAVVDVAVVHETPTTVTYLRHVPPLPPLYHSVAATFYAVLLFCPHVVLRYTVVRHLRDGLPHCALYIYRVRAPMPRLRLTFPHTLLAGGAFATTLPTTPAFCIYWLMIRTAGRIDLWFDDIGRLDGSIPAFPPEYQLKHAFCFRTVKFP